MLIAQKNGVGVYASAFLELAEVHGADWFTKNKDGFVCSLCRKPAVLVRANKSGAARGAHFRVPGAPDCKNHKKGAVVTPADNQVPGPLLAEINKGGVIAIEFGQTGDTSGAQRRQSASMDAVDGQAAGPITQQSESFHRFLVYLSTIQGFPMDDLRLSTPERGEFYATDYFCHVNEVTPEHTKVVKDGWGQLMGYWGTLEKANPNINLFFTFPGMPDFFAILAGKYADNLREKIGIDKWSELDGWNILFETRLRVNEQGSTWGRIAPERVAFLPPLWTTP